MSIEKLWNMRYDWSAAAQLARAMMVAVSVFAAAHYLCSIGVPLSVARTILLGI
jgi:hypothetical protein